jgi:hypothetical protein
VDDAQKSRARRYCGRAGNAQLRSRSDCRSPRHSSKNASTYAPKLRIVLSSASNTQGFDQYNMSGTNKSPRRILIRESFVSLIKMTPSLMTIWYDSHLPAFARRGASWKKGSRPLVSSARVKWQEIVRGGCKGFHPAAMCTASCLASVQPYPRSSASGYSACGPAK